MIHARVTRVDGTEHRGRLGRPIGLPYVVHVQHGQHHAFLVAKAQPVTSFQSRAQLVGNVQRHRDRPQRAAGQAHPVAHRLVVRSAHEPAKRGEAAVEQQFEVAQLARRQVPRRPSHRFGLELCRAGRRNHEVDERAAMRADQVIHHVEGCYVSGPKAWRWLASASRHGRMAPKPSRSRRALLSTE